MENLFVAGIVQHRVVESRDEEHQKEAHTEDTHPKAHKRIATTLGVAPHRSKRHGQQHEDAHNAVGYGIADLLAKCRNVNLYHDKLFMLMPPRHDMNFRYSDG